MRVSSPLEHWQSERSPIELLDDSVSLHLDHYGGARLPFGCIAAHGIRQRMIALEGPDAGRSVEVLDASGGYASACLGAGHPVVLQAFREAAEHSGYVTDEVASLERARFLERLFGPAGLFTDQFDAREYHVCGRNSGSEAIELALRLVFEHGFDRRELAPRRDRADRRTILAFEGAWHGWTAGALALVNRRHYHVGLPLWSEGSRDGMRVAFLPFGEQGVLESFFRERGRTLAAAFVEPVQGDAGVIVPGSTYLRRLSDLCREYDVLLVADEVLTFAKTGRFFAMADAEGPIASDVTVIGKSLGMGAFSTSLVIARRGLDLRKCGAVSTSDLRPLTCAVMGAGLSHIADRGLLPQSEQLGKELRTRLKHQVVDRFPELFREVRGAGFLNGIELTAAAAHALPSFRKRLIEHGVYVEFMGGAGRRSHGLRFLQPAMRIAPPLIATVTEIETIVECIAAASGAFLHGELWGMHGHS